MLTNFKALPFGIPVGNPRPTPSALGPYQCLVMFLLPTVVVLTSWPKIEVPSWWFLNPLKAKAFTLTAGVNLDVEAFEDSSCFGGLSLLFFPVMWSPILGCSFRSAVIDSCFGWWLRLVVLPQMVFRCEGEPVLHRSA